MTFGEHIKVSILYSAANIQWVWCFYPYQYNREADGNEDVPRVDQTVANFMPGKVEASSSHTDLEKFVAFTNPGLSIRQWLTHLHYIFSHPTLEDLFIVETRRTYDMEGIKETIEGFNLKTLAFCPNCSETFAQLAIRNFPFVARNRTHAILKGLNYQEMPSGYVRYFKLLTIEGWECDLKLKAGYDIRRKDGTVGTISFHRSDEGYDFHYAVWD
ncbi:hypothetical protein CRE_07093 [Caenorhabditis remanei]|uniref:F-box associated domain-containing protein n=1 Tax=Caenorhabditis remanei TaxID=31234 RepID=E3NLJ2_CAERE|nr:hypothetical protein CRE_07093 [Caenorhabditis remanei]